MTVAEMIKEITEERRECVDEWYKVEGADNKGRDNKRFYLYGKVEVYTEVLNMLGKIESEEKR